MKVVIDTNVLVSAVLSPRGVPGLILNLFEQQAFEWLISEEIFQEYAVALQYDRVRKRHKLTNEYLLRLLRSCLKRVTSGLSRHYLAVYQSQFERFNGGMACIAALQTLRFRLFKQLLRDLRSAAILVKPTFTLNVMVSDPDDNKLFECALEGGAHFIISGDVGVQAIKNYQEIQVLSPKVFLAMLEQPE